MPRPSSSAARTEPRDVAELKRLKVRHPELATAVDLQLALLDLQRRVETRVSLPTSLIQSDPTATLDTGRPLLPFRDLPLDWSDFRYTLRETADVLVRFEVMERADHLRLTVLTRAGRDLEPVVERWYSWATSRMAGAGAGVEATAPPDDLAGYDQALSLAMRPFLTRCAEAILPRLDLTRWGRGFCPLCGGDHEMAVITPRAERWLICGRCRGRWPFDPVACPSCGNSDRLRLTSFATPDGRYRINACDVCLRYVKAYDERCTDRPILIAADAIATLPLDAAAMQRGYVA